MTSETVLILGGAGFIGSHIADALAARGYRIRILDILDPRVHPTGKPAYLSKEYELIVGDICNRSLMEKALDGVSAVFHQAAYQDYMPDYSRFFQTNVVGTALLYELIVAMRLEVRRIVVASSQAVYGEGQYRCDKHGLILPDSRSAEQMQCGEWEITCPSCKAPMKAMSLREEYPHPYNPYALSKYGQETTALRLGAQNGLPTVALRYSIVQGPRQSLFNTYSGICRNFSLRLMHGERPLIYEDGLQTRDFIHVDDVVRANLLALDCDAMTWEALNVGTDQPTTVLDYTRRMIRTMKKDVEPLLPGEYRVGDNRHSVSNSEKLKRHGWSPRKDLDDIMKDYLAWLSEQPHIQASFRQSYEEMKKKQIVRQALC